MKREDCKKGMVVWHKGWKLFIKIKSKPNVHGRVTTSELGDDVQEHIRDLRPLTAREKGEVVKS